MLRVCVFMLITVTSWELYSAQGTGNDFKVKLLETSVTGCKDEYFGCSDTELIVSDFNETLATANGMIAIIKDIPDDMNISMKVDAQQANNDFSTVFDKNMTLCSYFKEYPALSGILTDFWTRDEDKEQPRECPLTSGSYVITDTWVNETRLPQVPAGVEMYVVNLRLDYGEPGIFACKFQVQIVR